MVVVSGFRELFLTFGHGAENPNQLQDVQLLPVCFFFAVALFFLTHAHTHSTPEVWLYTVHPDPAGKHFPRERLRSGLLPASSSFQAYSFIQRRHLHWEKEEK